ncbi:MAG: hypothetical protein M0R80_23665 [Proteobacteria bacterium]|jgi:hypothetical protein|nr:hypothetical protein [Pseudomonadota bacterium]
MKRWKVEAFSAGQRIASGKAGNLSQAMEQAQGLVVGVGERWACITNRITGKLKTRYWWDGQLQRIDY